MYKSCLKEYKDKRCLLTLDLKLFTAKVEIPDSSCIGKVTVDIDILTTSRNGDRKIM